MSEKSSSQTQKALWLCVAFAVLLCIAAAWYAFTPGAEQPQPVTSTTSSATSSLTGTVVGTATTATSQTTSLYPPPSLGEQQGILTLGGQTIYADLAQNPAQQELGLGNRSSLGAHQGMLFIFPNDDVHEFWMKDMSFSIDMIWMSDDGTVIYIQPNVAPSTYPNAFGPNQLSRYVLEVPANFAADHDITVGDKATLP